MPSHRRRPVHALIQRLWDLKGIKSSLDVAARTGVNPADVRYAIDVDTTENLILRNEEWADRAGVSVDEFLDAMKEYIHEKRRRIS